MMGFDGDHCNIKAQCPGACVSHQHTAGGGIKVQVCQQDSGKKEIGDHVSSQSFFKDQAKGQHHDHTETGAQPVHTIGTVCYIDGDPEEDNAQYGKDRFWYFQLRKTKGDGGTVKIQESENSHSGDDEVDQTFFVFIPRRLGSIVQVSAQHNAEKQYGVDDILFVKRHKENRAEDKTDDKRQPNAPCLTF